jgi:hypothetical protein
MILAPTVWRQTGAAPYSDKGDFPNRINEPKRAYWSESTLKSLGDQHPSKLMTRVRSFTCSNAFASYDGQRVAAASRLAGLTNQGDGFI